MSSEIHTNEAEAKSERQTLSEALGDVRQSLMRVATSIVRLPMSALPKESRSHFENAGSEISHGLSSLLRSIADGMDVADDNDDENNDGKPGKGLGRKQE